MSFEGLLRRIALMVGRGIVKLCSDDQPMQTLQIDALSGETLPDVEKLQPYGFSSVPHPGAEVLFLSLGGMRENAVAVIADDRRYRFKGMQPGEVVLYTDEGDIIRFHRGKRIEVVSGAQVDVTAPDVKISTQRLAVEASESISMKTGNFSLEADTMKLKAPDSTADTPTLKVTGDVLDKSGSGGKTMSGMRATFDSHTHNEVDLEGGGVTSEPNQKM